MRRKKAKGASNNLSDYFNGMITMLQELPSFLIAVCNCKMVFITFTDAGLSFKHLQ